MEPTLWYETPSRFLYYSAAAALTAAVLFLLQPFIGANSATGVATYSRGLLRVAIPYQAAHRGAGRLILEVLDPEDRIIGSSEKTLEITESDGQWKQDLRLDRVLSLDEVVWHRLRYRFVYDDTKIPDLVGTESISQILRMPVLHIRGQQSYLSGSQASIRVIVTDSQNDLIPGRAALRIDLKGPEKERRNLYNGHLNQRGTTEANVQFPAGLVGNCELLYTVDTSIGSTEFTQTVRLQDKVGILLTTEKPVYQPGQTIHIRALALDRANHNAAANRPLTFEVEDSRGNKVLRKRQVPTSSALRPRNFRSRAKSISARIICGLCWVNPARIRTTLPKLRSMSKNTFSRNSRSSSTSPPRTTRSSMGIARATV